MRIFGSSVFKYLSGMEPCDIIVGINEVPDSSVREKLYKVLKLAVGSHSMINGCFDTSCFIKSEY